jgi:hypothetical protein
MIRGPATPVAPIGARRGPTARPNKRRRARANLRAPCPVCWHAALLGVGLDERLAKLSIQIHLADALSAQAHACDRAPRARHGALHKHAARTQEDRHARGARAGHSTRRTTAGTGQGLPRARFEGRVAAGGEAKPPAQGGGMTGARRCGRTVVGLHRSDEAQPHLGRGKGEGGSVLRGCKCSAGRGGG